MTFYQSNHLWLASQQGCHSWRFTCNNGVLGIMMIDDIWGNWIVISHKHTFGFLPFPFSQSIKNDISINLLILSPSFLVIIVVPGIGRPIAHCLSSLYSLIELSLLLFQVGWYDFMIDIADPLRTVQQFIHLTSRFRPCMSDLLLGCVLLTNQLPWFASKNVVYVLFFQKMFESLLVDTVCRVAVAFIIFDCLLSGVVSTV